MDGKRTCPSCCLQQCHPSPHRMWVLTEPAPAFFALLTDPAGNLSLRRLLLELGRAVVRLLPPGVAAVGHHGVVVQLGVRREVVRLDVVHVDRLLHARGLVHLPHVVADVGILPQRLLVGLEVYHVHLIKADQGDKQADVRLGEHVARKVPLLVKDPLQPVQRAKQLPEGLVVRLLGLCKTAAVDAVVDVWVDPLRGRVDLLAQSLGVQVQLRVLGELIEIAVEHAHDLRALVVDYGAQLLVPEHRH
mmetsp:Transcript_17883/g.46594  ORF Transcript_17883/g.46594 Transcript_17883/m.46594 type:complete len:247 (-) Transcript_17883:595-1335(-)